MDLFLLSAVSLTTFEDAAAIRGRFTHNPKQNMKTTLLILTAIILTGCADNKDLVLNGKLQTFEPYGWADIDELKNDSIHYKINTGNVVWSIVGVETVFLPVWLTGWQIYEPVSVKKEYEGYEPPKQVKTISDSFNLKYNP